jgi:hypothetical protein
MALVGPHDAPLSRAELSPVFGYYMPQRKSLPILYPEAVVQENVSGRHG